MSLWLIQLIPTSWLNFAALMTLVLGAVLFLAGKLFRRSRLLRQYNLPMRVVGFVMLLAGAYFNGGLGVEMEYRARIAEMESRIAVAEAKSEQENIKIVKEIETKTQVIQQDTDATLAEIERLKQKEKELREQNQSLLSETCELTPSVIELYNQGLSGGTQNE